MTNYSIIFHLQINYLLSYKTIIQRESQDNMHLIVVVFFHYEKSIYEANPTVKDDDMFW